MMQVTTKSFDGRHCSSLQSRICSWRSPTNRSYKSTQIHFILTSIQKTNVMKY